MTSTVRWIKERIDKRLRLLFREYLNDEMETLLPLNLHYQRYIESTPTDRQSQYDHTLDPAAHLPLFGSLKGRLVEAGIAVEEVRIDLADFDAWRRSVPGLDRFYQSFGDMHIEKCLEHYLVDKLLHLKAGDRYLDIASAGSPWASTLCQRQIEAYRLDLIYPDGIRGMEIGANATATGLPDGFATALSTQCAFELFHGETDLRFLHEAARILTPGGRLAVLPLYLDDAYFLLQSPFALPPPGTAEPEATVIWRDDHFRAAYSRHYSPEAFARAIYSRLPAGLDARVYFVSNLEELMLIYPDQRIYCFYILQATKKADQPQATEDGR
jgi:SAM-dependent methyltransferase